MLEQPGWTPTDPRFAKRLLDEHPWVTLVSLGSAGLVASHLPVVADHDASGPLTAWGHLPRKDAALHDLGSGPALLVAQGLHGYVSPGWYTDQTSVPTWDYTAVHLHGTAEPVDDATARLVLHRTVAHMEARRQSPWVMDEQHSEMLSLMPGVVAFRLVARRVLVKAKLGQRLSESVAEEVLTGLQTDDAYANPPLAEAIRLSRRPTF